MIDSSLDHSVPGIVLEILQPDPDRLELGRTRMEAIAQGREPDRMPFVGPGLPVPERSAHPRFDMSEQYFSKEKMLYEHIWSLVSLSRAGTDAQLSVRANFGTAFLATLFGLEQRVFTDKMPWLTEHLPKEAIIAYEPVGLEAKGLMPMAREYIGYFKEALAGKANIFLSDTQGPFDLAHLVYGDAIFYDMYDDPAFVHMLLDKCTRVYVGASALMKEWIGEPLDRGYHWDHYMGSGGVRVCEDTTTLLSPDQVREFSLPYIERAVAPFGGGWVHFCGTGHHFLEALMDTPGVRGINFGNPERYDFGQVLPALQERGMYYVGHLPRVEGETPEGYAKRIHGYLRGEKRGLILNPSVSHTELPDFERAWENIWV